MFPAARYCDFPRLGLLPERVCRAICYGGGDSLHTLCVYHLFSFSPLSGPGRTITNRHWKHNGHHLLTLSPESRNSSKTVTNFKCTLVHLYGFVSFCNISRFLKALSLVSNFYNAVCFKHLNFHFKVKSSFQFRT